MKTKLANKQCAPCDGKTPRLEGAALNNLKNELGGEWNVVNGHHLERVYKFKDFRQALAFVNRAGEIAEQMGHHPNICFTWGEARVNIFTHSVDGLTENDFVLAARVEEAK